MRTEEEILKKLYLSIEKDGQASNRSYEQGFQDALNWAIRNEDNRSVIRTSFYPSTKITN